MYEKNACRLYLFDSFSILAVTPKIAVTFLLPLDSEDGVNPEIAEVQVSLRNDKNIWIKTPRVDGAHIHICEHVCV